MFDSDMKTKIKVLVAGTRGIPNIPGGVEKHCEELYPRLAARNIEVYLTTRSPYIKNKINIWNNINLINCYAPRKKSLEAIIHTFIAVLKALTLKPDIIHIHSIGPALLVPFARLLGFKVIFTTHGADYKRQKWGKVAKILLMLGEMVGGKFANKTISISSEIAEIIKQRCKTKAEIIPNGVTLSEISKSTDWLESKQIKPGKYILCVARFVPEKGLDLLMKAFEKAQTDFQLVIAGDADHETEYSKKIKTMAEKNSNIILTGYITGQILNEVFSHAAIFLLPSFHEGLPIALLEAMSYGLPVLVSDIRAHKDMSLPQKSYFKCGDKNNLSEMIEQWINNFSKDYDKDSAINFIKNNYNWEIIADQTAMIYQKVLTH